MVHDGVELLVTSTKAMVVVPDGRAVVVNTLLPEAARVVLNAVPFTV